MPKSGVWDVFVHCQSSSMSNGTLQWNLTANAFCFKMAALEEKKRTTPRGADTLMWSKQSVDSSSLKINTKEWGNILFISVCECIILLFLLVVCRSDELVITCRTEHRFPEILHYSPKWAQRLDASDSERRAEYLKDFYSTSLKSTGWKKFHIRMIEGDGWGNLPNSGAVFSEGRRSDWQLMRWLCSSYQDRDETLTMLYVKST